MGEFSEAEDALSEANILNNLDPVVWAYLVLLCQHTNRPTEAEQALKYAIKVREKESYTVCWNTLFSNFWPLHFNKAFPHNLFIKLCSQHSLLCLGLIAYMYVHMHDIYTCMLSSQGKVQVYNMYVCSSFLHFFWCD